GMTTELRDENHNPYFTGSIGQTFYLRKSEMATLEGNINDFPDRSALAGEFSYSLNKQWQFDLALQLNEKQSAVTQSKSSINYHFSDSKLLQLSHRYVKQINDTKISQLGLQTVWPINSEWTFVGNYHRDINLNRTIEAFAGLQYESCCWAIRVQAYRQLQAQYEDNVNTLNVATEEFDNGISFNFEIKGLGSNSSSNAYDMLSDGLFTYRKPYYLKQ
ncbi:MAG: LPS assembly protein LptD, partial [Psychrobium sp.]